MLPNTRSTVFVLAGRSSLWHVNLPVLSNQVKPAHTLSPGGDASEAPVTCAALAMGGRGCLNCLLEPLRPAGSLLRSLPEPGRLIKARAALARGTRRASRAAGTGTAASAAAADITTGSSRY